jgi:hypothetical protein
MTSFAFLFSRRLTNLECELADELASATGSPLSGVRVEFQPADRIALLLADHERPAARPRLSSSWRERVRRCNYLRLQFVLREVAWVQGHEEIGVRRFSAFAERRIVSIGNVCDLLGNANELTLFSDQRDNVPRRSNVQPLEHFEVLGQDLFGEQPYERRRVCPCGEQGGARIVCWFASKSRDAGDQHGCVDDASRRLLPPLRRQPSAPASCVRDDTT